MSLFPQQFTQTHVLSSLTCKKLETGTPAISSDSGKCSNTIPIRLGLQQSHRTFVKVEYLFKFKRLLAVAYVTTDFSSRKKLTKDFDFLCIVLMMHYSHAELRKTVKISHNVDGILSLKVWFLLSTFSNKNFSNLTQGYVQKQVL